MDKKSHNKRLWLYWKEKGGELDFSTFTSIIGDFNKMAMSDVVYNGKAISLSYGTGNLGYIVALKCKRNFLKKVVDFNESKKQGYTVYYSDDYYYFIHWVRFYRSWKFIPRRGDISSGMNWFKNLVRFVRSNPLASSRYLDGVHRGVVLYTGSQRMREFNSITACAKHLDCSASTVRRYIDKNKYFKGYKICSS